jgi:hypothetical protein
MRGKTSEASVRPTMEETWRASLLAGMDFLTSIPTARRPSLVESVRPMAVDSAPGYPTAPRTVGEHLKKRWWFGASQLDVAELSSISSKPATDYRIKTRHL